MGARRPRCKDDCKRLTAAVILMPVAVVATVAGAAMIKRMRAEVFYPIVYALIFVLSLKLIWDGVLAVW